jgi:hypothetical protein
VPCHFSGAADGLSTVHGCSEQLWGRPSTSRFAE